MTLIYVSTDVETDGPVPGLNSMLSFGSAAFLADKTLLSTFTANLETLPETHANPVTVEWWKNYPDAWATCRENPQLPDVAIKAYADWIHHLPGQVVFVAYPLLFDYGFINYYFQRFLGKNPFGLNAIDIRSYIMGRLHLNYDDAHRTKIDKKWFDDLPHTHVALDDALEQGALFCNVLNG